MSNHQTFVVKAKKPLGAAFSHARKVAAKTGGGQKKEREVANRYLKRNGEKAIGKSDAAEVLEDYLAKGGEGSRGGRIIGHTQSGKPIYQHGHSTGGYTAEEHLEARDAHMSAAKTLRKRTGKGIAGNEKDHAKHQALLQRVYDHHDMAVDHVNAHRQQSGQKFFNDEAYVKTPRGTGAPNAAIKKSLTLENVMTKNSPAAAMLADHLSKAATKAPGRKGEGSRGGKIIGHTRSGKPIYATAGAGHAEYVHFTNNDHQDAAQLHEDHRGELEAKAGQSRADGITKQAKMFDRQASSHEDIAGDHSRTARIGVAAKPGDNAAQTRSGAKKKIPKTDMYSLGMTSSGKPVYAEQSAKHYDGFTKQDHEDAGNLHREHQFRHDDLLQGARLSGKTVSAQIADAAVDHHSAMADDHFNIAEREADSASKKDLVIGHTKSGKAIRADGGDTASYSTADHADAAKHHADASAQTNGDGPHDHEGHLGSHFDHVKRALGSADAAHEFIDSRYGRRDGPGHGNLADLSGKTAAKPAVKNLKDGSEFYDVPNSIAKHKPSANHIIATTKSNKSIMADGSGTRGFSVADHEDAASAHSREAQKHIDVGMRHGDAGNGAKSDFHQAAADHHLDERDGHLAAARSKRKSEAAAAPSKDRAYHATAASLHDRIGDHHAQLSEMAMDHGDDDGEFHHRTEAEQHRAIAANHRAKLATKSESTNDFLAADALGAYLAKGGEGSRGGKITGHTKSGKPIYASGGHASGGMSADYHEAMHQAHKTAFREASRSQDFAGKEFHRKKAEFHRDSAAVMRAKDAKAKKSFGAVESDGDEFANENNANPDRILVRPVMDVENSPLNDAIAAAWPGMPFVAQAASNFCAMDTQGKLGI
jgi:hypothetical protein